MDATSPMEWARLSFGGAALGDHRRTDRLVKIGGAFAAAAGGTICRVITAPHQAKAAYRLLDNPDLTHEAVTAHHMRLTLEQADAPGCYLLIEDTTTFNYQSLKATTGLGPIGEDFTRGFFTHSCLVTRADLDAGTHVPIGLLGQTLWARPVERPAGRPGSNGPGKECNNARQKRVDRGESESHRWGLAFERIGGPMAGTDWVYVADRESDIYSVFQACWTHGCNFVIRCAHDRALSDEHGGKCLKETAANAPVRGEVKLTLPDGGRVMMRVRSEALKLRGPKRPGGALEDHSINVVRLEQTDAKAGQTPLLWVLLTDLPTGDMSACLRVIRAYKCRWLIEEFHKVLKTGLEVEESQLSTARRLMALVGVLSVVAIFLLQARAAGRERPEELIDAKTTDPVVVKVLETLHPPKDGRATLKWFYHSIAKMGGFMGRKADGDPGWLTLWRGWQTLATMTRGYELAMKQGKDVGNG